MQVRLLRFLENHKIRRIGDVREIQVDCRVIAATNADIFEQVAEGVFREDLLYRLKVVTINVPPLRDRREDIPILADHFARQFCAAQGMLWRENFRNLPPAEDRALRDLVPATRERLTEAKVSAERQAACLDSARELRRLVGERDITAQVSLYLSSHGDGVGGFCQGFTFEVKPEITFAQTYGRLNRSLAQAAATVSRESGLPTDYYHDGMRADRLHPWEGLLPDRPGLGGEIGAIAGTLGLTLATVNDGRFAWGTPADTPDRVDIPALSRQSRFVAGLVAAMSWGQVLAAIPWKAWAGPMASWAVFVGLCYVVLLCLANLFSKQWISNEHMAPEVSEEIRLMSATLRWISSLAEDCSSEAVAMDRT